MLEKMDDFFTSRIDGYDEHMKSNIEGASLFYKFTASLLPVIENAKILDLGCGTGLELEEFFLVNPNAKVTGIDLTEAMLDSLKAKFPDKDITTICGSYFDVPFGDGIFDAAVSVESLHHFSKEEKIANARGMLRKQPVLSVTGLLSTLIIHHCIRIASILMRHHTRLQKP